MWGVKLLRIAKMFETAGKPFKSVMSGVRGRATSVASSAKSAAKKMVVGVVLFVVILWVAALLYASFYHVYVPTATIVRPAHFKFRVCPSGVGMCSFPMANITLGLENKPEVLGRGQQYRVLLQMRVPDSMPNRDLGMFMVMIRMFDRYGVITQESSRAVSLKYQSDLSKIIQTVVFSPLYITGFAEETQMLSINLFDFYWDDYYQPSVGVLLEIHSRQLVFYTAQLQFHASYAGLRYYLFHYPITCAILGILFNCLWLTPALLVPWYTLGLGMINGNNTCVTIPARREGRRGPQAREAEGEERMGGQGEGDGGDDGEGGGEDDGNGFTEVEPEDKEVETVPRYCLQPFSMAKLSDPP